MRIKPLLKKWYSTFAFALSIIICIVLIIILYDKYQNTLGFTEQLKKMTSIFIGISGFLAAILMIFLAASAMKQQNRKAELTEKIGKTTQKMHNFRSIAEILVNSNLWLPGLKDYMEKDFSNLSYFEVKEFYNGKSKLAIEFLQEKPRFSKTENLYLEAKALLMTKQTNKQLGETLEYPIYYESDIVQKWVKHKCGSGLWYAFGYKFGDYRKALNLEAVTDRHQEKILTLANTIDNEVFEKSSFNEVFFAKLWEYLTKDVVPTLFHFQKELTRKTPQLIYYLYAVFVLLIIFGVLFPMLYLILNFSVFFIILSYSIVLSTIFYISITFHIFLSKEVNS